MKKISKKLIAVVGLTVFTLGFTISLSAFAATTPTLGAASIFGVISSTFTRNIGLTVINGAIGYTTLSGGGTHGVSGTTYVPAPAQAGIDQGAALSNLNGQTCTAIGSVVDLATFDIDGVGPILPGHFTPGCYSSTGAMNIGGGGTITLDGVGTYIFRSDGALGTTANSSVTLNGASACDLFWTPTGATTLGANSTFVGNVIDPAGITIGNNVMWSGQALAYGGTVTADTDTITVPACSIIPVVPIVSTTVAGQTHSN